MRKYVWPITAVVVSIILGSSFYATQLIKQESIENQQKIKMADDQKIEQIKLEQTKKEYISKRKGECYGIYEKERAKWNNVVEPKYIESRDVCVIKYKSDKKAEPKETCSEIIKSVKPETSSELTNMFFDLYYDCQNNYFSKEY